MTARRSLQEWIHWLEAGAGGRWVTRAAVILGVVLLSLRIGYTQFHGPLTEHTLAQAVVGRQLADGAGFVTPINYPQTVAWMKARAATTAMPGDKSGFDAETLLPELHRPPLYSIAIGGVLKLFPEKMRDELFNTVPEPPNGFRADYVLLVLNIVLLWLAAWQTFALGRRLFDDWVGTVAAGGLLLSTAIWSETLALNGVPLAMVLLLALVHALVRAAGKDETGARPTGAVVAVGAACGGLFLADYSALAALAVALAWLWRSGTKTARTRWKNVAVVSAVFAAIAGPWCVRNIVLTGNPTALAWQGIALKAGDPTAEPARVRATLSAEAPRLELAKLGNKMLTSLQASLRDKLWSGGAIFFAAFFVTGLVYPFRGDGVNRARWLCVALIAALMVAQAFFDSGEGELLPVVYATPLIAVFGAGFFAVLIASNDRLRSHARGAAVVLLAVQALPLARDVVEPRRQWHFNYPPYYPPLFMGMSTEMSARGGMHPAWAADVPAGAAWYSGQRVWAQPATVRDFYGVCQEQAQIALVLTPHTLDRPFFGELTKRAQGAGELADWSEVYAGLVTNRFPAGFPLSLSQKVSDNFFVLLDPLALRKQ